MKIILVTLACLLPAAGALAQGDTPRRRAFLDDILRINTPRDHRHAISRRVTLQDSTWMDWLRRSGELPPDFDSLPLVTGLPDPLLPLVNGRPQPVRTKADWRRQRERIKEAFQYWVSGKVPPPPGKVDAVVTEQREEDGVLLQRVSLRFGPAMRARMRLELMVPLQREGPLPVYMVPWTHRNWAQLAVRRGYIGCVYAAADDMDDTQAYQQLYPSYDFTGLMRRAWGAARVVDYLVTRPEVDKARIAISGHSRNGKQALWAAAFDERISAVVSSSCGTGGVTPWRYSDPQYCNQTIDDICANAAHWFHPRLRFFFGRENRLPTEQNLLLSLIAPRALLLHYSTVERQLNPWATEQCYQSVKRVYRFLEAENNIGVLPRMGEHAVATRDVERCIDYLDIHFGRRKLPWENRLYFTDTFAAWAKAHPDSSAAKSMQPLVLQPRYADSADWQQQRARIKERLQWLLGPTPPGVKPAVVAPTIAARVDWIKGITGYPAVTGARVLQLGPYTAMGDHLSGTLYCPQDSPGAAPVKRPVVIYLHQYAYAHGYALGYSAEGDGRGNSRLFQAMIDRGFAVLAIDLFGFGPRLEEAQFFYQRFPDWSKMGKMVQEVSACVDALQSMEQVDPARIFVMGNTIGGSVALMAAALDTRIAGVAVAAAFTPWRSGKLGRQSLYDYYEAHSLLPRLGWFAGRQAGAPLDFGEIMACIAPRPLMVIAPLLDSHADAAAIKQTMRQVQNVYDLYKEPFNLVFQAPREINRLTREMCAGMLDFYGGERSAGLTLQ